MVCKATGYPRATIKWFYNHNPVSPSGYLQLKQNGGVLQILHAKKEIHQGSYSCLTRNKYGVDTKQILVNVQGYNLGILIKLSKLLNHFILKNLLIFTEKLHLDRNFYLKEVAVIRGQRIKLVCPISPGLYGKYSIVWYKNDRKISYYRNRNIKLLGTHKEIMIINSASMSDKAKYSCVASNSFSKDKLDFLLNVLGMFMQLLK